MSVEDVWAVDEAAGFGGACQDLGQRVSLGLALGVAKGGAVLDLEQRQVERGNRVLHRVVAAILDAALEELVRQHPQRRLVGRTLQRASNEQIRKRVPESRAHEYACVWLCA